MDKQSDETVGVEITSGADLIEHEPSLEPDLYVVKCEETEPSSQMIELEITKEDNSDYNDDNSCDRSNFLTPTPVL